MQSLIIGLLLNFFVVPFEMETRTKKIKGISIADYATTKFKTNKKKFIFDLFRKEVLLFHTKYAVVPLLGISIISSLLFHFMRCNDPIFNHFDFGYIAQIAVRKHHNRLLKLYLSLGLNPGFRDSGLMTLFEYAFLNNNQEAGRCLAQYQNVVKNACIPVHLEDGFKTPGMIVKIASPFLFFVHHFLKKVIEKKYLETSDGQKSLAQYLNEQENKTKLYQAGTQYNGLPYQEVNKTVFMLEVKIFEKICLNQDFLKEDIRFLSNHVRLVVNDYDAECGQLNEYKATLQLQ